MAFKLKQDKSAKTPTANVGAMTAPVDPDMPEGAQEIDDGDVDELLQLKEGESISGVYMGHKETRSGQVGKMSTLHKVRVASGTTVGLWGSYQLDQKLGRIENGQAVWVKYVGKDSLANGNTMHTYRVARIAADALPF